MDDDDQLDVRRFARVLWRRAWLVVLCGLLFAGAGYVVALQQPDRYQASTSVRLLDPDDERVFGGADSRVDLERDALSEIAVITSGDVRARADDALGEESEEILDVSASARSSTEVVEVRVVASTAQAARDGADAVADAYLTQRQATIRAVFEGRARELRAKSAELGEQVDELTRRIADEPENANALREQRNDLTGQIEEFDRRVTQQDVEAEAHTASAVVVERAALPTGPFEPRPVRTALICGFIGILFGIVFLLVRYRLSDTVTVDDAASVAGAPLLGSIDRRGRRPAFGRGLPSAPRTLLDGDELDPYRILRTNLRHACAPPGRTIVITSPAGSEGTSTITANLALALTESDLRVVAVSADLRRPTLGSYFGIDDRAPGLSEVLAGSETVPAAAHRVQVARGMLYVVPSGQLPPDPVAHLENGALASMVAWLKDAGADYLLVDAPPVLPVADAAVLSRVADDVVIVCSEEMTRRGDLRDAVDRLRQVDAHVVGLVVNGTSTGHRYATDGQCAPSARSTAGSVLRTMRVSSPSDHAST